MQTSPAQALLDAQGYSYALKVDTGAPTAVTGVTCALQATAVNCSAPLTAAQSAAVAGGPHTLTLTASNAFGSASSDPLAGSPPGKPGGFTISIVITVTP